MQNYVHYTLHIMCINYTLCVLSAHLICKIKGIASKIGKQIQEMIVIRTIFPIFAVLQLKTIALLKGQD